MSKVIKIHLILFYKHFCSTHTRASRRRNTTRNSSTKKNKELSESKNCRETFVEFLNECLLLNDNDYVIQFLQTNFFLSVQLSSSYTSLRNARTRGFFKYFGKSCY